MLEKAKELFKVGISLFSASLMLGVMPVLAKTDSTVGETVSKSSEQTHIQQSVESVENAVRVQTGNLGNRQVQTNVVGSTSVKNNVQAERGLELTLPSVVPSKVEEKRSEVNNMITTLHQSGSSDESALGTQSVSTAEREVVQQNFVNSIQTANDAFKIAHTQILDTRKDAVKNAVTRDEHKSAIESYQSALADLVAKMQESKQSLIDGIRVMLGDL